MKAKLIISIRNAAVVALLTFFANDLVAAREKVTPVQGAAPQVFVPQPRVIRLSQKGKQPKRRPAPQRQTAPQGGAGAAATLDPEQWNKYKAGLEQKFQMLQSKDLTPSEMLNIIAIVKEKLPLTQEQISELDRMAREVAIVDREASLEQQVQQLKLLLQQQQVGLFQPQVPFSVSGAVEGVTGVGKQAVGQVKSYYDWMKEKMYNAVTGSYVSGLGNAKYIAPGVLLAAAGPVGMLAAGLGGLLVGGTAALTTGGAGLAIWGLENIVDRANFMKLSGGHGTTESWLKTLRAQLSFVLDNKAAYPYLLAKKEALLSRNELYSAEEDPTGIVRQAHDAVLAECQAKLAALQPGSPELQQEQDFVNKVATIRRNNGFANLTPDQYIATLRTNNDLIQAEALVSEYNRALNKKVLQEIAAKKQADAQKALLAAVPVEVAPTETPAETTTE